MNQSQEIIILKYIPGIDRKPQSGFNVALYYLHSLIGKQQTGNGIIKLGSDLESDNHPLSVQIRINSGDKQSIQEIILNSIPSESDIIDRSKIIHSDNFERLFKNIINHLDLNNTIEFNLDSMVVLLKTMGENKDLSAESVRDLILDIKYYCQLREESFTKNSSNGSAVPKFTSDINGHVDDKGNTLLHKCAAESNFKLLEVLVLEKGADVNIENNTGESPLYIIVKKLYEFRFEYYRSQKDRQDVEEMVELLLNNNANANSPYHKSSLYYAILAGNYNITAMLLPVTEKREQPRLGLWGEITSFYDPWYINYIFDALESNREILSLLKQYGANFNTKNWDGETLLILAVRSLPSYNKIKDMRRSYLRSVSGCKDRLEEDHLEKFDDENIEVLKTKFQDSLTTIDFLLENGADPCITNKDGLTPLHILIRYNDLRFVDHGFEQIFHRLIAKGASISAKDKLGCTPLSLALEYKCEEVLQYQRQKEKAQQTSLQSTCLFSLFYHPKFRSDALNTGSNFYVKELIEAYKP